MKALSMFVILLATVPALEAKASGCGGPWTTATGKETVVETVKTVFDFPASQAECRSHPTHSRYTFCTVRVKPSPIAFSDVFDGWTIQAMMAQFSSMDGREVEVEKVNREWEEYDDCTGDSKKWWKGYYRLKAGMNKPMYAPGSLEHDGLPPF